MVRDYSLTETAKEIRAALKASFPKTVFSVRTKRYSGGCSTDVSWTDGPTSKQVDPILHRFESQGFDGMIDLSYYCGRRMYKGERADFSSGYVRGERTNSRQLMTAVTDRVCYEVGIKAPELDKWDSFPDHQLSVPFAWFDHYMRCAADDMDKQYLTMADIEAPGHLLARDSHKTEYVSRLIDRIACSVSLEETQPGAVLPEYLKDEVAA
jgi:hypothetical protein